MMNTPNEVAHVLYSNKPNIDPRYINQIELRRWIVEMDNINTTYGEINESFLKTVRQHWIKSVFIEPLLSKVEIH